MNTIDDDAIIIIAVLHGTHKLLKPFVIEIF